MFFFLEQHVVNFNIFTDPTVVKLACFPVPTFITSARLNKSISAPCATSLEQGPTTHLFPGVEQGVYVL